MSAALGLIALALALGALALSSFYAAVTFAGVVGTKRAPTGDAGPIAVVIPAHDEEASIALAIGDLKPQLRAQDRLIVVADNCADRTAAVARSAGATVIERDDGAHRGKGFALQFALDALRPAPPDIVCVVDADCRIEKGAIALIAGAAAKSGRPAQSLDLMVAPAGAPPRLAVAEFAWLLMNKVRVRGLYSLFDASRLCGTGMAFPWKVIEARSLATSEIVEDLALGLDLAAAGAAPIFCADAVVRSEFPSVGRGGRSPARALGARLPARGDAEGARAFCNKPFSGKRARCCARRRCDDPTADGLRRRPGGRLRPVRVRCGAGRCRRAAVRRRGGRTLLERDIRCMGRTWSARIAIEVGHCRRRLRFQQDEGLWR